MKKILSVLMALAISLGAESLEESMGKIFDKSDKAVAPVSASCEYKCRKVDTTYYGTQIIGIDFLSGTTKCKIFQKNDYTKSLAYGADKTYPKCEADWKAQVVAQEPKLISASVAKGGGVASDISYIENSKEITLSRFLSGLVTLDPTIIDKDTTSKTGQLTLKSGITTRGAITGTWDAPLGSVGDFFGMDKKKNINNALNEGQKKSLADSFGKANLAYFSNLFENMQDVYKYLQNLLFIIVGGFFVGTIGTKKIQTYLENRGEISSHSQPYLHRFYVPLLAVGLFFAPIPESGSLNGDTATVMQNMIRYFTKIGTDVADRASAVGAKTYMNKMYANVGGIGEEGELLVRAELIKQQFIKNKATQVYENMCAKRYPNLKDFGVSYFNMTPEEIKEIEKSDGGNKAGTELDISFGACLAIKGDIFNANAEIDKQKKILKGIENYYNNNELGKNLKHIDTYLKTRENELGWINSTLIAGSALMVELQDFITNNEMIKDKDKESLVKSNQTAVADLVRQGEVDNKISKLADAPREFIAFLVGRLAWYILPGAGEIHGFFSGAGDLVGKLFKNPLAEVAGSIAGHGAGYTFTPIIMESIVEKLPTLVVTVASMVAFISYLVALCKYFYISPFAVVYGLTMRRMDKIVEFLISGIAIFFKPILIVMFIYLALFLHTLIKEFFIFNSITQFAVFEVSDSNYWAIISTESIKSMLKVFSYLASAFIMWKLIMKGADWTLELLGLKGGQDNVMIESLSHKLEHNVFRG